MRQLIVLTAALVFSSLDAQAADLNVASVFPDRTHDFGTVARGSQLRHRFRIVNTTGQELRIAETRTKCGCTEVKLGAKVIPARAESYVDAVLDTTKFLGPKKSGLTLIIDRPVFSEVDLNLNCFIRGDILVNPGQVEFGNVPHGKSTSRVLTLEYQGVAAGWQITGMNTISSAISAKLDPPVRTTGGGLQYSLTATLNPSAPVGFLKEEIELITNDPNSPRIPLSVSGNVQAAVTVSPATMLLGTLKPSAEVNKKVLLKASKPFKIVSLKARQGEITGKSSSDDAKTLHEVTLTFKSPAKIGGCNAVLEIQTDLEDEPPATVSVFGQIAN